MARKEMKALITLEGVPVQNFTDNLAGAIRERIQEALPDANVIVSHSEWWAFEHEDPDDETSPLVLNEDALKGGAHRPKMQRLSISVTNSAAELIRAFRLQDLVCSLPTEKGPG